MKVKKSRTTTRGGALLLISVLMIGSALIRIGLEAGPALAREGGTESMQKAADTQSHDSPAEADLHALLATLRQREADLNQRESTVMERMRALEIAEVAIDRKLADLTQAEEALRETVAAASVAAESDLSRLTEVYEKMKPKESAALFEEMDATFAAGFLARMRPEAAADIMAGLSPKVAYTISVVLAGRNANVPTE
ncbi:hypothetical protein KBY27_20495 [Ruegeria pomeroyi]|uniref:Magnesium transporter MgtE intracellular domain-containing protein n=1 Tax=Ruegeria pomeroyi TaxID=89184 RepID=A0A9Q3ZRF9_9RHOB|nr:hypothetical protein [Ruegeria pomeroyi]MCE8539849.1 hypothetical protein [Ruegeria pomeroyi]